ncbi:hypothetical protein PsYK624_132120 [Phanerochaete sordida]|uniref:Reverse transcriptase domain-containing protein n=1 Tax=Phanerochaete sordida TaxID=48140 RepID=A0A9P3LK88_9APHY|nr:hypothetical protein PsYK624_132120 [Phanerochaete sordida]
MIHARQPHAWVLNETKSTQPMASHIAASDYTVFEAPGVPLVGARGVDPCHAGRLVAVDIVVPTAGGRGFPHRLIGVYAPWDPGTDASSVDEFWTYVSTLCTSSPYSWSVIGDCNVTMTASESTALSDRPSPARTAYLRFLQAADGFDVWHTQGDADARHVYTFHNHQGQSVLDRCASSRKGSLTASCEVLTDFIPNTDHRPLLASIALVAPVTRATANLSTHSERPSYPPRLRYPHRGEKQRFDDFVTLVDEAVLSEGLDQQQVTDDASFNTLYSALTRILRAAGVEAFGLPPVGTSASTAPRKPHNMKIRAILTELRHVNRLIAAVKRGALDHLRFSEPWAQRYITAYSESPGVPPPWDPTYDDALLRYLADLRRALNRLRYRAERDELHSRATKRSQARVNATLLGGSAKRLYAHAHDSDGPPVALASPEDPLTFLTEPDRIRTATVAYFQQLFTRQDRPPAPKPWLDSPSIRAIREGARNDPFDWPRPLSLPELRLLLRKGNSRPAPGPDLWEKWAIKTLSDSALGLVLRLVNYEIVHSHFPASTKPSLMTTIHKRGPRTDLANYRGITCSNLVYNLPFAWLNHLLLPYLVRHRIIPHTQVATQPGVQGRDLSSFLAQVEAYAHRHKMPIYILRRDQKKGFDRLEPEGFYDAVAAYGLPSALIDLDRSAQADVPYQVKTAYGLTRTFSVTGVTKQGGSFSPLKSTLTTSMCNHWLHDDLPADSLVTFRTDQSCRGKPHTPDDALSLTVTMVEVMDDSAIITLGPSLAAPRRACHRAERFQSSYGWESNWPKSLLAGLNTPPLPSHVLVPSVDPADPSSSSIPMHPVAFTTRHCEFQRVMVNDQDAQFLRLRDLIQSFELPTTFTRLPITALRRIFAQCLVSRIRPALAYQPIRRTDAASLDRALATRVHEYFSFPFHFNSVLLSLPLRNFGLDFPSISRLNDSAAVTGMLRDLNHHVPAFANMSRITLADWTCQLNNCIFPLDSPLTRSFTRSRNVLPTAWITAYDVLRATGTAICATDMSYIYAGDVALRHLVRNHPQSLAPSSHAITNLERAGYTRLHHLARWDPGHIGLPEMPLLTIHTHLPHALSRYAAYRDWPAVRAWLQRLTLPVLVDGLRGALTIARLPPANDPLPEWSAACTAAHRRWMLALPREMRRAWLERLIDAFITASPGAPLPPRFAGVLASDGSAVSRGGDNSHVTFAATSTAGTLLAEIDPSSAASSLHAEIYGLVVATLLAERLPDPQCTLYTDHLNSVRFLQGNQSVPPTARLLQTAPQPGHALYAWLLAILQRTDRSPAITYTRAHTASRSIPALANKVVDHLASHAHSAPLVFSSRYRR